MIPQSLAEATALLKQGAADAFSFDVFDTVLFRRSTLPDGVFERAFHHAPLPAAYRSLVESYVQHRTIAEVRARQQKMAEAQTGEVTIGEIYDHFPMQVFGLTAEDRPLLIEAEFQAELELCFANAEMVGLLREAAAQGLRVGFLSDTFWPRDYLTRLLRHTIPDLAFDFLYPSCEFGRNKASGLFEVMLVRERLTGPRLIHIGDHPIADGEAPARLGIKTIFYPQCEEGFYQILRREEMIARLVRAEHGQMSLRADLGLRVMRRLVAARLPPGLPPGRALGAAVLGPLFAGFQSYVERRVAEIRQPGRKVAVAFLARDGFLLKMIWDRQTTEPAHYIEINRRIAIVASAASLDPLVELFSQIQMVDQAVLESFLKLKIPGSAAFFQRYPRGMVSGAEFAKVMPAVVNEAVVKESAGRLRQSLMGYLRGALPELDSLTDLVLVDLGYYGNIQKYLRDVLDIEGVGTRLHGVYLASVDNSFARLKGGDTAGGYLDDSVVTPVTKLGLLRNIAILEQFAGAPVGSCRAYQDSEVLREADHRDPAQLRLAEAVRHGIVDFLETYRTAAAELGIDPLGEVASARPWAMAILARLLLLPTDGERNLLRGMEQDVNLGSSQRIAMLPVEDTARAWHSLSFRDVCQVREPPMWLAGALADRLPVAGYSYAMAVFGHVPTDVFAETTREKLQLTVIGNAESAMVPGSLQATAFGEWRLRVPVARKHTGSVLAVPLAGVLSRGLLRSLLIQTGRSVGEAMSSRAVYPIAATDVHGLNALVDGNFFRANTADAHLLIPVPPIGDEVAVVTVSFISDAGE